MWRKERSASSEEGFATALAQLLLQKGKKENELFRKKEAEWK